ncbi:RING-H2 finger protein ATL39-like [Ananas comosus]|uniref:RING-type E3 ubiquitin transferase n=1 Tax=Ananas comosus TaxID=4615 RepID=A0A6P5FPZ4_ANACO|nr:RING-H2 finger protein ATL39-like [Ananas comosus]
MSSDVQNTSSCCSFLGAVATVFAVFFVLLILFLCACYILLRRCRQAAAADALDDDPPPPADGLDPSAIASLPSFAYYSTGGSSRAGSGDGGRDKASAVVVDCSVCLDAVEEGATVRLLPSCMHLFHQECIDVWLSLHATCPVCRANPEPKRAAVARLDCLYIGGDMSAFDGEGNSRGGREGGVVGVGAWGGGPIGMSNMSMEGRI